MFYLLAVFLCLPGVARAFTSYGYKTDVHRVDAEARSFTKLVALIDASKKTKAPIQSPEGLLAAFRADSAWQPMLAAPVLMASSRSAQRGGVSEKCPRTILHRDRLFLGFTNEPKHPRTFKTLEAFDYDPDLDTWNTYAIEFTKGAAPTVHWEPEKTSGLDCRTCHGETKRPLWATYPFWLGSIGSLDDTVEFNGDAKFPERTWFDAFLKDQRHVGRYEFLVFPDPIYRPVSYGTFLADAPNSRLNQHFQRLNFRRVQRILRDGKMYPRYGYAMAASLLDCETIEGFFPADIRRAHRARLGQGYMGLLVETHRITAALFEKQRDRARKLVGDRMLEVHNPDANDVPLLAKLRYVVEGAGIDMEAWSLHREPGGYAYSFSSPERGIQDLLRYEIWPELQKHDAALKADSIDTDTNYRDFAEKYCGVLRDKSLEVLDGAV